MARIVDKVHIFSQLFKKDFQGGLILYGPPLSFHEHTANSTERTMF